MKLHSFAVIALIAGIIPSAWAAPAVLPASHAEQSGKPIEGAAKPGIVVIANDGPDAKSGLLLDFDLSSIQGSFTPEARLQLGEVEKLTVKRPGKPMTAERAVMQVFYDAGDGKWKLAGSLPTKAGGMVNTYVIDVTPAVNAALAKGEKKLRLDLELGGKPLPYEVYGVSDGTQKRAVSLEVASPAGWVDDLDARLEPIWSAPVIYRQSCLPMTDSRDKEATLNLLFPAKKVTEVMYPFTGEKYEEGRDYVVRDGKVVVPVGSRIPVQLESEFFTDTKTDKDGNVKTSKVTVRLVPDTWYHERQIAVSYEPERNWKFAPPISSIEKLPRLKKLLAEKKPITVVLFGDSISAGGDTSSLHFVPPYQLNFGELVARKLAKEYGTEVTFINPARAGATSAYGRGQVSAQVGGFKPDLAIVAYGMNDRAPERRVEYKKNIEKIIDTIRADSPETEFVVVTPMLNNPKQPTGLDPVKFIRDEALSISRPGLAFADMTTTELDMINHVDYLDLSGNGANHPNDFLHRVYAQRILETLLPPVK